MICEVWGYVGMLQMDKISGFGRCVGSGGVDGGDRGGGSKGNGVRGWEGVNMKT